MNQHQALRLINRMISLGLDPVDIIDKEKERQSQLRSLSNTLGYKLYKMLEPYNWSSIDESGEIHIYPSENRHDDIIAGAKLIGVEVVISNTVGHVLHISDEHIAEDIFSDFIQVDLLTHPTIRDFSNQHEEGYHYSLKRRLQN